MYLYRYKIYIICDILAIYFLYLHYAFIEYNNM